MEVGLTFFWVGPFLPQHPRPAQTLSLVRPKVYKYIFRNVYNFFVILRQEKSSQIAQKIEDIKMMAVTTALYLFNR